MLKFEDGCVQARNVFYECMTENWIELQLNDHVEFYSEY